MSKKCSLVIKSLLLWTVFFSCPTFAYEARPNLYYKFDAFEKFYGSIDFTLNESDEAFWVKGYTDAEGPADYNLELSRLRAETVKNELMQLFSLNASQVIVTPFGEDSASGRSRQEQRRVEVISGTRAEINRLAGQSTTNEFVETNDGAGTDTDIEQNQNAVRSDEAAVDSGDTYGQAIGQSTEASTKTEHRYNFGLGVYSSLLEAVDRETGAVATWVSGVNYSLGGEYQVGFGNFWLGVKGSYHFQDYEVELSEMFVWDEKVPNLMHFSLTSDYEWSRLGLGFDINYNQVSFFYENLFNVNLREIFMLGATLRASFKWLQASRWSSRIGLSLNQNLFGANEIEPEGRLGYGAYIDLNRGQVLNSLGLNLRLNYTYTDNSNDQNDQTDQTLGLAIVLRSPNWL